MSIKKTNIITLLVLLGILFMLAAGLYFFKQYVQNTERDAAASSSLSVTEEAPYTDLEGNDFSFEDFKGQVRVVNAWASWCPFCVNELQDFETLAAEYADQDVVVIAVNRKEPREKAKAFLRTLDDFNHTHFAIDLTDAFYKSVGGFSMPETVFFDAQGNIIMHKRGVMSLEEMRTHTEAALTPPTN